MASPAGDRDPETAEVGAPLPRGPEVARGAPDGEAPAGGVLTEVRIEPLEVELEPPLRPAREEPAWRPARRMPPVRREPPNRGLWLRALWTSAKIGVVLFLAYGLMFNFSVVRGSSMAPGIHDGDRILVDHLSYVFGDVRRGDIVVLQYPLDPALDYIKRVIGVPGDRVEIADGIVRVNGERLTEPYVVEQDPRARLSVVVGADHFFVLGDNRPHSSDSREFGQVPRENLRGRVEVRVWPPERMGTLE